MDWLKKSMKYMVIGGGVGVLAYWVYIKAVKYRINQQRKETSDILDKSLGLDTTLSDSVFNEISSNVIDNLISDNEVTFDESTIVNQSDFAENSTGEDTEGKSCKKVLLLGLEKSGKSRLLAKLSRNVQVDVEYTPTKGYNVVCISYATVNISIWEIGGSPLYRVYWRNFCATTDLVLFVVDASEKEKFAEVKEYIFEVVAELEDRVDFHIVATRTEDTNAVSLKQLESILGVKRLNIPIHTIDMESCSDHSSAQELLKCCLAKLSESEANLL